jgi:large subunit ribosomal protein L13
MEYVIDATQKKLGRLGTEIATILRGKNSPDFTPHIMSKNSVKVVNASKMDISQDRLSETYTRYSGYPGGLKHETRKSVLERKGYQAIIVATVKGMLPANKHRDQLLLNITVEE